MWKKVTLDILSVLKDNIFKYICPKYRARAEITEELKKLSNRFRECLNPQKPFSLYSMMNTPLSILNQPDLPDDIKSVYKSLEHKRNEVILLNSWLDFFAKRIDSTYLRYAKKNIEEFLKILILTYLLFQDFFNNLENNKKNSAIDNSIRYLKSNNFPTFKNEYEDIIRKLIELVENNSKTLKELKEIKRENYIGYLSLPVW